MFGGLERAAGLDDVRIVARSGVHLIRRNGCVFS